MARRGRILVVVFRGSVTLKNALTDLNMTRTSLPFAPPTQVSHLQHLKQLSTNLFTGDAKVHTGFWSAYSAIRPQLLQALATILGQAPAQFTLPPVPAVAPITRADDQPSTSAVAAVAAGAAPPETPPHSSFAAQYDTPSHTATAAAATASLLDVDDLDATESSFFFSCLPGLGDDPAPVSKGARQSSRRASAGSAAPVAVGNGGRRRSGSRPHARALSQADTADLLLGPASTPQRIRRATVAGAKAGAEGTAEAGAAASVSVTSRPDSMAGFSPLASMAEIDEKGDAVMSDSADEVHAQFVPPLADEELGTAPESDEPFTVYCTGHSLGGALSALAAYDLRLQFAKVTNLEHYTFGSPRIGNHAFATEFDAVCPRSYRGTRPNEAPSSAGWARFVTVGGVLFFRCPFPWLALSLC